MVAQLPSPSESNLTLLECCVPTSTPLSHIAREDSSFARSLTSKITVHQPSTRDRTWSHWSQKTSLSTQSSLNFRSSPSSPSSRQTSALLASAAPLLDVFGPADLHDLGTDAQGIPWSRFSIAREEYRLRRMQEFTNYNNVQWNAKLEIARRLTVTSPHSISEFFAFARNFRTIAATIDHFQLRQLLHTPDNVHAYYVANSTLHKLNKVTGQVVRIHAQSTNQMACVHVAHGFAVSGAFDSEVVCSSLPSVGAPFTGGARLIGGGTMRGSGPMGNEGIVIFRKKVSEADNSITNSVLLVREGESAEVRLLVGNNDQTLKEFDVSKGGAMVADHTLPWPVNHVSAFGNVMCVAGDACELALLDRRSRDKVGSLSGHLDFAFCSDWKDANTVASGSQDGTCRIFDIRKSQTPVRVLGTVLGAARSVKFSPCGNFLAFSEPADYVHLYDVSSNYEHAQVLDFFGNTAGIAFSPDSSKLSVSIADSMFGCLMEFRRSAPNERELN